MTIQLYGIIGISIENAFQDQQVTKNLGDGLYVYTIVLLDQSSSKINLDKKGMS